MFKSKDIVPDIDFSQKGWEHLWSTVAPKRGNKIVLLYPNGLTRRCIYSTWGDLRDEDTNSPVILSQLDEQVVRWRYKKPGIKFDHEPDYGY